jgi:hypothetical protein
VFGEDSLVTIESYLSHMDADMARLKLQSAGFTVFLDNEYAVVANALYGPATGGIKLRVPADQALPALALIAPEKVRACPACKSLNVYRKPLSKWMFVFALLCLTLPLWLVKREWICGDCGNEWGINTR